MHLRKLIIAIHCSSFISLMLTMTAFLQSSVTFAQGEDQTTVREQCRKAVGGAVMQSRDAYDRSERYLILIERSLADNSKALKKTDQELAQLRQRLSQVDFDIPLSEERVRLESLVSTMSKRDEELTLLRAQAKQDFSKAKARKEAIEQQTTQVFQIVKSDDGTEAGYPFRVQYLTGCPKYRYLCPLPPKQAKALLQIKTDNEMPPESCRRYSEMLGLK